MPSNDPIVEKPKVAAGQTFSQKTNQLPTRFDAQRTYGLALGYEEPHDHDQWRHDPLLGLLTGKRKTQQPLVGKSTLNRLELSTARPTLYK